MRPIRYKYDPSAKVLGAPPTHEFFSFMSDTSGRTDELEHAIVLNPTALDVPWPTSFPVSMQCKHWEAAEIAARELIDKIAQCKADDKGILPEDMEKLTTSEAKAKMEELLDTSVSITVNVWPWASCKRIGLIAQACLLLFLHDDVVESESYAGKGNTILDGALYNLRYETVSTSQKWSNRIFAEYAKNVLDEEPELGLDLLKGILDFVNFSRSRPPLTTKFKSFKECVEYRMRDVGHSFAKATIKFACDLKLSDVEMEPLATLNELYGFHGSMSNDLYSFSKEYRDAKENNAALVNGVSVLQDLLGITPASAKTILCLYLWDIEGQVHEEYKRLLKEGTLNNRQVRYARALMEGLAGNLFHMATLYRYANAANVQ